MEDPILDALIKATGWADITPQPSGYVIRFGAFDRNRIKGLARDSDTFFLLHEEFKEIPIVFLLQFDDENTYYQYWTLNQHLHRMDGPAYVMFNADRKILERRFYYHGLPHQDSQPAIEKYIGYGIDTETFANHIIETWDSAEFKWMLHGENKGTFGRFAHLGDGQCYRRRSDRVFDSPEDFGPSFSTTEMVIEWTEWIYDRTKEKDGIRPHTLCFENLTEDYKNGKLISRSCDEFTGNWVYRGKVQNSNRNDSPDDPPPWLAKFNKNVKKNLLKEMDIWGGSIYPSEEIEFYFLTEFNSCYEK